jgi:hypothetical protein
MNLKKVNLFKWFFIGMIIGLILAIAMEINSGWDGGTMLVYVPLFCGFALITFRKWLRRTFWF